jgi:hypothetical protein
MCVADVEGQIDLLASQLEPPDREPFRQAAEAALAGIAPLCWGPGLIHRVVGPIWRSFFHPPDAHDTAWSNSGERLGKLVRQGERNRLK